MVLHYEELRRLSPGHDKGITKVAFSPSGRYLATAGLDYKICIWDIYSGEPLHSFNGTTAVLSLVWIPPADDTVICGLHDGNMAIIKITPTNVTLSGFWAHAFPVECLAVKPGDYRLASGAHKELLVWQWDTRTSKFCLERDVTDLTKKPQNAADEVIITSLHWMSTSERPALLLVTYMYHGLLLIDATNWTRFRTIGLHQQIASASLSDDGRRLAISNVLRGFEVYSMESGAPLCSIDDEAGETSPIPVLFVHGSLALLGGSTKGTLYIWDVLDTVTGGPTLNVPEDDEPEPRILHELQIPKRAKALAVDAYYNEDQDEFFVAAGVMNEYSRSICVIWKAVERGGTQFVVGNNARSRILRICQAVLLAMLCAAVLGYSLSG